MFEEVEGRLTCRMLLQRRDVGLSHAIKRPVLPSGEVSFDAERNAKGYADEFWAVAMACQRGQPLERAGGGGERGAGHRIGG